MSLPASAEELKFITLEVAPWAYVDEKNGSYKGIFSDIVSELEKRTGYEIKITLTPYARINRELEAGRQDCTILIRGEQRDQITVLGSFVFDHPMGVIPKKSTNLKEYKDLYGLRVSVLRGLLLTQEFSNDNNFNKEYDTSYEIGLKKIQHDRLDAIAGAIPTIQFLAKKNNYEHLLGEPLVLSEEPIYLQCSKKSKNFDLIEGINKTLDVIRLDGTLDNILSQY